METKTENTERKRIIRKENREYGNKNRESGNKPQRPEQASPRPVIRRAGAVPDENPEKRPAHPYDAAPIAPLLFGLTVLTLICAAAMLFAAALRESPHYCAGLAFAGLFFVMSSGLACLAYKEMQDSRKGRNGDGTSKGETL